MATSVRHNYTFSVNPIRLIVATLEARRVDVQKLLDTHRLTREQLEDLEGRIPLESARGILEDAGRLLGEPDIGLAIGRKGSLGVGVIRYAVQAAPTLGEGFRTLSQLHRLITDVGQIAVEEDGDRARVVLYTPRTDAGLGRQLAEMYLALWLRGARELTGVDWNPIAVRFRHPEPPRLDLHREVFRAPLTFDHDNDQIELDRAKLALPLKTAEPTLARILGRYGQEILSRLPPSNDFSVAVQQIVAGSLGNEELTLERLATRFKMTPRTLQRRLSQHGLTLRVMIDDARRQLALRYLARPELSISEIAFLLGFDAPTSFHRAFRRWTGLTPSRFREDSRARSD